MVEFSDMDMKSQFDCGLSTVYIIDSVMKALINARISNDYNKRFKLLESLFFIYYKVAKKEQREHHLEMWKKMKANLELINSTKKKGLNRIPREVLDEFDYWELELSELQQDRNLGIAKKRDSRFALSN